MLQILQKISVGFMSGGMWMWVILICQIFSFAIIIERIYSLYIRRKPDQMQRVQSLEKVIKSGNLHSIVSNKNQSAQEPIDQVALVGAQSAMNFGGKEEIQLKMDEVLVETSQRLDKNTAFLGTIANVSTLLGLLGTIIGMIEAFSSLGAASAAERSSLLAQGISVAMYTTAYGLVVAIPSLAAYAVLQNRSQKLMEDLNKASMKLFIWLTYSFESITPLPTTKSKSSTSKG